MEILNWSIDEGLLSELANHYRSKFALSNKQLSPIEIARAITFDGASPDLTFKDAQQLLVLVNAFAQGVMSGTIVELGAGCGFFSAAIATLPNVEQVYAVDACANIVTELMPRVVSGLIGERAERVIGCIGEFEHIELQNESVDAIFDFYSLHHAPDLGKAFREMYRVLKPDGAVICLDKARADRLTDTYLEKLLDTEYSMEAKREMGIPIEICQTRRMNGEREFRRRDWDRFSYEAGFRSFEHIHLARIAGGSSIIRAIKRLLAHLPIRFQRLFLYPFPAREVSHLECAPIAFVREVEHFPKEPSLMVIRK